MPQYNRASRDWEFIPGIGGSLQISHYDAQRVLSPDKFYFDIETYRIKHLYKNKVTTHSGSNGATLRTRVGGDWSFTAILSAPPGNFLELMLGSWRSISVIFNLGDPLFWKGQNLEPRTYRGAKVLLEEVDIIGDSRGEEVVMAEVFCVGNSLLWGYVGESPIAATLWP